MEVEKQELQEGRDNKYINKVKERIKDMNDVEKISHLLEKVGYWHWSAGDWRASYEQELRKNTEEERNE